MLILVHFIFGKMAGLNSKAGHIFLELFLLRPIVYKTFCLLKLIRGGTVIRNEANSTQKATFH